MVASELSDEELRKKYHTFKKQYDEEIKMAMHTKSILYDLKEEIEIRCNIERFIEKEEKK
jgi:hypothetical protein